MSEARAAVTAHMEALRMRSSSTQSSSTTGAGSSAPGSRQQSQDTGAAQVCMVFFDGTGNGLGGTCVANCQCWCGFLLPPVCL